MGRGDVIDEAMARRRLPLLDNIERWENAKQELVSEAVATKQAAIFRFIILLSLLGFVYCVARLLAAA